jgi:predicted membrane chloride channel (bestrophin family)
VKLLRAGIDEVGNEIEEPFSILPLDTIAAKSRSDLTELVEKHRQNRDVGRSIIMTHSFTSFK